MDLPREFLRRSIAFCDFQGSGGLVLNRTCEGVGDSGNLYREGMVVASMYPASRGANSKFYGDILKS